MSFAVDLNAEHALLGGKARSLGELAAAGFSTPTGFAIADALFRSLCPSLPTIDRIDQATLAMLDTLRDRFIREPWPAGFQDELQSRLGSIGAASYAVRSSFAGEDVAGQLAAGVYESRIDVPADLVDEAIRQVLCSVFSPGAVAYALTRGKQPATAPVAVLIHAFIRGEADGSAAFAPKHMAEPLVTVRRGPLPADAHAELCTGVASLARSRGPVEIEWVLSAGRVIYLQARPFEPPVAPAVWAGWNDLNGEAGARDAWRWDAAHNPLPLSPAQAGLVALVDKACSIGMRQRVLGGYLFYRRDDRPLPLAIDCKEASSYFACLRARVEARLVALGPRPTLDAAVALFLSAYEPIFGVLQPALREAHKNLSQFLQTHAPEGLALVPILRAGVDSMASERRTRAAKISSANGEDDRAQGIADYLGLFGDEAPIWDVCASTYAETPDALVVRESSGMASPSVFSLDWRHASAEVEAMLAPALHEGWRHTLALAREAVCLGEADDWLYARVQAAVRRALLALGERLHQSAAIANLADVFYLPFELVQEIASRTAIPANLNAAAGAGRAEWERACANPPPSPVDGRGRTMVRGAGTGGRAIGRVIWHRPELRIPVAVDAVLVAKTLLPTELPLINAVAIVTETGGPLDHVAAQARERGIPAVVGADGASSAFGEGDVVLVDADRGVVVRLL
jgi:pyruvate,water dikinase